MMYCTVQYIHPCSKLGEESYTGSPRNCSDQSDLIPRRFMDRRNFLSGSLAASALSLATAGDLVAQAGSATDKSAPEYMDLRRYHLANGPGVKLTTAFFADAFIPALNRLGIGPVGAFSVYLGPDSPSFYLLMPSSKLETLVTADQEWAKDDVFMGGAAPFWVPPAAAPPCIRIESPLLREFRGYPKLTPPAS